MSELGDPGPVPAPLAPPVALAVDRTVLRRDELDWLPPRFKAIRWGVAGSIWGAVGAMLVAAIPFGKTFYLFGKGIAVVVTAGYFAGDRAARAVLRRRLGKLAHGATNLGTFGHEADGQLLHVRGRVRARRTLPSLLTGEPAVFRRLVLTLGETQIVHEAAVDFALVDATGEAITVLAEGARLLAPEPKHRAIAPELLPALRALPLPAKSGVVIDKMIARRERGKRIGKIMGGETLVRDGDEVELVGYKTRVIDPSVATLARETPMRATLRSGRDLPLLIAPARGQPPSVAPPSPGGGT